jgi:iron complex outermembrane receptor protein
MVEDSPVKLATRLALFVLALLLPTVALADPKDDARRHFMGGLEAAKAGQYEVSLQHFLAAWDAYPHPATAYNIARAYHDLGDLPNALTYFRLYQDAVPPDKADDVAPTIAVLEARLRQERPGLETAPTVTAEPGQMVVVGPSEEELARLAAIAAELDALTSALSERRVTEVAVAPTPTEPGPTEPGPTEPTDLDLPEEGFISEAYERVVVTASRYGQEPLDSPSTVTVLTDEDIRLSGVTSIPDLLRRVVGVEVMQPAAGHADVGIRGFNRELSNKVLILIDGRSTYLDFIGSTMWESMPISLEEVERIEVIRGPGSAVYGANAVTGVINIITRTPGEGQNLVTVEAGLPNYGYGSLVVTGRKGPVSWRFSGGYQQSARWGQDFDPTEHSAEVSWFGENENLGLQMFRGNGRVDGTFLEDGYVSLSAGFSQGLYEFYNIGALDDFGLDYTHTYLRSDLAYGPVHMRAFWNTDTGFIAPWWGLRGDPRTLDTDMDADTVDIEIESNGEFHTGKVEHRINGGLGYRYKRLSDFLFAGQKPGDPPIVENHYNAFLSEEATIAWVKLVATLRADVHPNIDLSRTLSPRGSIIFRVAENTAVRMTGGSAFRAPNMVENYMDFRLGAGVDGVFIQDFGDIDLSPERIITAEVGLHDESTLYHTADVAVYYNNLTDIISLQDVTSSRKPYDPEEEGYEAGETGWVNTETSFQGLGVEAELELFPTDGLDIFANLNYTAIFETTPAGTVRDTSTSVWKVNAGAMYRTPYYTDIAADVSYLGPQTWRLRTFDAEGRLVPNPQDLPARIIANARIAVRPTQDEHVEIAGTLWNIGAFFDKRGERGFQEHPKGHLIGPRAFATLSYEF